MTEKYDLAQEDVGIPSSNRLPSFQIIIPHLHVRFPSRFDLVYRQWRLSQSSVHANVLDRCIWRINFLESVIIGRDLEQRQLWR